MFLVFRSDDQESFAPERKTGPATMCDTFQKTECRMKFRYHMLKKEETDDTQGNKELIIDEFCNGTPALGALYTLTIVALLGTALHSMNF